jgi:hypothetical protein
MDIREIGWGSVGWFQLAQNRVRWRALVNTVMNLRVLAQGSSSGIESDKSAHKNKSSLLKKEYSKVTAEKML